VALNINKLISILAPDSPAGAAQARPFDLRPLLTDARLTPSFIVSQSPFSTMPKAEKGTPKDIANRMKAKGLQKLKFYCQMCAKQCRDENGFKCHMTSDSHLRQMQIFRSNAGGMMDSFSREFESAYLETLRRRHGTQRMNANNVYQEVIQDKQHVHMNSTKWTTLTDFVQYLGKKGHCVVEETERGWYVTYIERDPALLSQREKAEQRAAQERREEALAAERREAMRLEAARALDRAGCSVDRKASEIGDREGGEGVKMEMKLGGNAKKAGGKRQRGKIKVSLLEEEEDEDEVEGNGDVNTNGRKEDGVKNKHRWERRQEDEHRTAKKREVERDDDNEKKQSKKHKHNGDRSDKRKDYWLYRDIVVRIVSKSLAGGEYYKRKAAVDRVIDKYEAEVEVLESGPAAGDGGDMLRIDQDDLETVVPREVGGKVRILGGRHRGRKARVESLDKERYRARLRLGDGEGTVELDYEDFSKMA
ncbi:hypothetical protein ACHAWF_016369, partial [Thalassiosira exigua]